MATRSLVRPPPQNSDAPATPAPAAPPVPPAVIQASLRYSIKDAVAWSVMQGTGTYYITPFIIFGGKGLLYVAAITAIPAFVGALVQWLAANVTDAAGRRTGIIAGSAFFQGLVWIPMCVAIFLPFDQLGYWVMLAAYGLHLALANFGGPAWQSVMGDLVPPERRGRYFGLRNALSGLVFVATFFAAGHWLTLCHRHGPPDLLGLSGRNFGFLVLFATAGAARLLSAWYLTRIYEPPYRVAQADRFTLLDFIRRAPRAHFGRFVFYCMLINVGVGAVTPFLPWFWLDQRGYSAAAFATVMAANLLAGVLSQPAWGRLVDRLGSKRVLGIGGLGLILSPPLLLICDSFWAFALIMAYDGIVYAAFTSAMATYLYDVVTPPKRVRCAAYNSLFIGAGTLIGSFGSALLGQYGHLPLQVGGVVVAEPFSLMLLCSMAIRLLANAVLLGSFSEFRLRTPALP